MKKVLLLFVVCLIALLAMGAATGYYGNFFGGGNLTNNVIDWNLDATFRNTLFLKNNHTVEWDYQKQDGTGTVPLLRTFDGTILVPSNLIFPVTPNSVAYLDAASTIQPITLGAGLSFAPPVLSVTGGGGGFWNTNVLNGSITNVNGGGISVGAGTNGPGELFFFDSTGTNLIGGFNTNGAATGFMANGGYTDAGGPGDSLSVAVSGPNGHLIYQLLGTNTTIINNLTTNVTFLNNISNYFVTNFFSSFYATNINAVTITSTTNIFNIGKGGTLILTNTISFITNIWPQGPTGIVQVATNYIQNFVSLTACSVTGITGKTSNQAEDVLMTFYNTSGTNWGLTLQAGIVEASGAPLTVPAGGIGMLWIHYNPQGPAGPTGETNAVFHAFPSSPLTATVNGTANQVTVTGGTENLTSNVSWTVSIANPLVAPGPVSGTQLTNTSFAANGVVTNDSGGKLYTTPTLPASLMGPIVTSFDVPMGAWFTNNCGNGADVSPASMLTLTNSGDTPVFTVSATTTNEIRTRYSMPRVWDLNPIQIHSFWACTGTNSASASKTNFVVKWDAAAVGPGDRLDNLTFGTAVFETNNCNPFPYEQGTEGISLPLTVGNSPGVGKGIIWRCQVLGNAAGSTETNASLYIAHFTVEYRWTPANSFSTPQ